MIQITQRQYQNKFYMNFSIKQKQLQKSKEKQQPYYVRHSRLKNSILKSKALLNKMVSIKSLKLKPLLNNSLESNISKELLQIQSQSIPINQQQLLKININSIKKSKMNIKNVIYSSKVQHQIKGEDTSCSMIENGLDVKKIQLIQYRRRDRDRESLDKWEKSSRRYDSDFQINLYSKIRKRIQTQICQETNRNQYRDRIKSYQKSKNKQLFINSINTQGQSSQKVLESSIGKQSISIPSLNPTKKYKKQYLYQKIMKNNQQKSSNHDKCALIYQKKMKSYLDFIWKCLISHNVYTNLDVLSTYDSKVKYRAYFGYGNNCNMVKSLIKRRFWWSIQEKYEIDCQFVWTQIKIDDIYKKQQKATQKDTSYLIDKQQSKLLYKKVYKSMNKINRQSFKSTYQNNLKLLNTQDYENLMPFFVQEHKDSTNSNGKDFNHKTKIINEKYKLLRPIDDKTRPIVHNHLQNNFYLGNKKALFYILKDYYNKIGQDVFEYIPYTFHIKKSTKDVQFQKFKSYYQSLKEKNAKKQYLGRAGGKFRNIWIVKPGQNSNQGRGITVIDEIYELENILKQSKTKRTINKDSSKSNESPKSPPIRTFIVQKYIQNPLLYHQRKFDLRHYLLITNLFGVIRAYWYSLGYIRTSSYEFSLTNFDREIHLTNDAIQKKYPYYGTYEPYNKISYHQFQQYVYSFVNKGYKFSDVLGQMKKISLDVVRSVYTKLVQGGNSQHNFQIFGLDFMIDSHFKPWLIEINTNPCLDCACPLLERIIPYMVQQSLKLSLDVIYPPPSHYPNHYKHLTPYINLEAFKYQLIFDSNIQGSTLRQLYKGQSKNAYQLLNEIGEIEDDQEFKDDGRQIKLEQYT